VKKVANRIFKQCFVYICKPFIFISGTISARDRETITRSKKRFAEAQKTGINRLSKIGLPAPGTIQHLAQTII